jgi:hypothetical protein
MVDNVGDQAQEAIDEVFPGTRLPRQTALQQISVDWMQGHAVVLRGNLRLLGKRPRRWATAAARRLVRQFHRDQR